MIRFIHAEKEGELYKVNGTDNLFVVSEFIYNNRVRFPIENASILETGILIITPRKNRKIFAFIDEPNIIDSIFKPSNVCLYSLPFVLNTNLYLIVTDKDSVIIKTNKGIMSFSINSPEVFIDFEGDDGVY